MNGFVITIADFRFKTYILILSSATTNRVQSEKFPDSITEVIHQPGQFSAIDDGQFNLKSNLSYLDEKIKP
ncbi:cell wall hydrolase [Paenibacillus sp. V4I5]|nr:cell wall hydrolase [Paenibacillus sp. V4I5]